MDIERAKRVLSDVSALSKGREAPSWDVADERQLRGEYLLVCLDFARGDVSSAGFTQSQLAALPPLDSPWVMAMSRSDGDWGHSVPVPDPRHPGELFGLDYVNLDESGLIESVTLARERTRMSAAEIIEDISLYDESDPFLLAVAGRVQGHEALGLGDSREDYEGFDF